MTDYPLKLIFKIALVIFMAGNMSAMGLQLSISDACRPLRSVRFVLTSLIIGFVIGPAISQLVVFFVPMEQPYATGLLLLGMTPCAPFLPLVVRRANGDLAAAAGLTLLASVGTILIMPLLVPMVAAGLPVSALSIARPLAILILLPLAAGTAIKSIWTAFAKRIYFYVNRITAIGTIMFVCMVLILNFQRFIGSIGSHALLAELLYVPAMAFVGYVSGVGMPAGRRSVISLGMCTRNVGAAAAIVGTDGDQRTMVMLVIATFVTIAVSAGAASWFAGATPKAPTDDTA
jgi:BASS family bile acid:Na+ symporter